MANSDLLNLIRISRSTNDRAGDIYRDYIDASNNSAIEIEDVTEYMNIRNEELNNSNNNKQ